MFFAAKLDALVKQRGFQVPAPVFAKVAVVKTDQMGVVVSLVDAEHQCVAEKQK